MKALREAFGDEILELGRENPDIYVIDGDISKSCKTQDFAKELPGQHVNVGIAEQNAAAMAAGIATCGKIPFISSYAVFGSLHMVEMIRQEICYPNLNVKIACSHGGLTPGNDGASHQGIEDYGVLRTLPNMTVIAPCDYYSCRKLIREAAQTYGPMYLRFTRDPVEDIYRGDEDFQIGRAVTLRDGSDVTIIAAGDVMAMAARACDILEEQGVRARLLDMHTIKPLDRDAVVKALDETGAVVTVEDHTIFNGLGSAVCEVCAEHGSGIVKRLGIRDRFGESGPYEKLLEDNGVSASLIAEACAELASAVQRRRKGNEIC